MVTNVTITIEKRDNLNPMCYFKDLLIPFKGMINQSIARLVKPHMNAKFSAPFHLLYSFKCVRDTLALSEMQNRKKRPLHYQLSFCSGGKKVSLNKPINPNLQMSAHFRRRKRNIRGCCQQNANKYTPYRSYCQCKTCSV
uniref:Uncharacterized protein n=1 Tax=Sphaerodactylus townsendi TaxID=933632 RepID=A0ACB8FWA2_9SAUR